MKKFNKKTAYLTAKMDTGILCVKNEVSKFIKKEDGDTNFISILVLLAIALALAGVFLVFKDRILGWVDQNIGDFFSQSGGR